MEYDPITLKVLWDRLIAITEDAAAAMCRTTFSPIVREGNDFCCSLIDIHGRQLAEPPFTLPSFTGTLPFTVRHFLKRYRIDELQPGDSIVTNDSWLGTGHLNDFNIATPVFHRGKPIAIASSTAHMSDIGGAINFGLNRDVHEEGIRIPITKFVRGGKLSDDLVELIRFNVRVPDQVMGDLTGMLVANHTMAQRLLELVEEERIDDFVTLSDEIQHRSEDAMRGAIAELPAGCYQGSVTFDGNTTPITIQAKVEIDDREVRVDYTGTSPQDSSVSVNVVMNYTYAFTVYPLKLLIHPRLPSNDGCLRPLKIYAPPGSILNAQYPVAGFSRNYVGHMMHAALFSALQEAVPDRVWAHSGSAPGGLDCLSGVRPEASAGRDPARALSEASAGRDPARALSEASAGRDPARALSNGQPYVHLFIATTGTGACPAKDGEIASFPTNVRSTTIEATEHLAPVLFERREIIPDSAGPGMYRGGFGTRWALRNIGSTPILYSGQVGRLRYPALGLLGGGAGRPNYLYLNGEPQTRGWGRWDLQPSDVFVKEHAGGGGLHSPLRRDPERVLEDVLEGYVSVERAREDYGVIVEDGKIVGFTPARQNAAR